MLLGGVYVGNLSRNRTGWNETLENSANQTMGNEDLGWAESGQG